MSKKEFESQEEFTIGDRFYSVRHTLKMTQSELAGKLYVVTIYISMIENNKKKPGIRLVNRLIDLCEKHGIELELGFIRPDYARKKKS